MNPEGGPRTLNFEGRTLKAEGKCDEAPLRHGPGKTGMCLMGARIVHLSVYKKVRERNFPSGDDFFGNLFFTQYFNDSRREQGISNAN